MCAIVDFNVSVGADLKYEALFMWSWVLLYSQPLTCFCVKVCRLGDAL